MPQSSGLTVRQHEREATNLSVEFIVAETHRGQVHFSQISSAPQPFVVLGVAADISSGGLRFECPQLLPRMCEGTIRVFDPRPRSDLQDGSELGEVVFEQRVKVRRVSMISHDPCYAMGLSFIDPEPGLEVQVGRLLRVVMEASVAADELEKQEGPGGDDHA